MMWCKDLFRCFSMIGHNNKTKPVSDNFLKVLFSVKTLKKSCFQNLKVYLLTKEILTVYDWGTYFIEYVFECYFLWNNCSYAFWDLRV